jgi:response regulator RpfG family c-di-GMP phosphodiesterase
MNENTVIQSQTSGQTTGKVLFVDDEENITKTLLRQFTLLGYDVFVANSGKEALEILNDQNIDTIISDMRMPEMDGVALLKEVSAKWPVISRILLTGYADLSSVISAVNNGKIHYCLTKPWEEGQIETAVRTSVETKLLKEKNKHLQHEIQIKNNELTKMNLNLTQMVEERTSDLQKTLTKLTQNYTAAVQICSNLITISDPKHLKQSQNVAALAKKIATSLSLIEEEVNNVYFSGMLYNLGKIGLPKEIMVKLYI